MGTGWRGRVSRSHVQVEEDALSLFPGVATLSGMPVERVAYGTLLMWAFCKNDGRSEVSERQMMSWYGERDVAPLKEAMAAFGFLDLAGKTIRVKGATRYIETSMARAQAGRKGGASAASTGTFKENFRLDRTLRAQLLRDYFNVRGQRYAAIRQRDDKAMRRLKKFGNDFEIRQRWIRGLKRRDHKRVHTLAQLAMRWNDLSEDGAGRVDTGQRAVQ